MKHFVYYFTVCCDKVFYSQTQKTETMVNFVVVVHALAILFSHRVWVIWWAMHFYNANPELFMETLTHTNSVILADPDGGRRGLVLDHREEFGIQHRLRFWHCGRHNLRDFTTCRKDCQGNNSWVFQNFVFPKDVILPCNWLASQPSSSGNCSLLAKYNVLVLHSEITHVPFMHMFVRMPI